MSIAFAARLAVACFLLSGCRAAPSRVDIDAPGFDRSTLSGSELLRIARAYSVATVFQFASMESRIQRASLQSSEKSRMRQRVDYLLTVTTESTALATTYSDPSFSEADRRQVFRAVCDRLAEVSKELLDLSTELRALDEPGRVPP